MLFLLLKLLKKNIKEREEIKNTKPKQNFEYIDFFFYNINTTTTADTTGSRTYGYFVIRDVETSTIYAIHSRNVNVSYDMISAFNTKKMNLYLNTSPRKDIQFGNKGIFWLLEILNNDFYFRNNDNVKIGVETFKYAGNIENVNNISSYNVLYNLNSSNDISLLDNVKFIKGIAEFNIND